MGELSEASKIGIRCAADIILRAKNAVLLSGAGLSTASGIPDFRSPDSGLWSHYDPFEVASLTAFRYNPEKFFSWLRTLAAEIRRAQPNLAHIGFAQLQQAGFLKTIVTQNIDSLHQRAGSSGVLEIHGTLETLTCGSCYSRVDSGPYIDAYLDQGEIPRCECGHVFKPDVVLFGEQLSARTWLAANNASKTCDLMIVAGSSLEVLPVAGLPVRALDNGAHLILINRGHTYLDMRADLVFNDDVVDIVPAIVDAVLSQQS